jgi:hypothetical protein
MGIPETEVTRRMGSGGYVKVAEAARQYQQQLRKAEPVDVTEQAMKANWLRAFAFSGADDMPDDIEEWELADDAFTQYELHPGEVTAFLSYAESSGSPSPYEDSGLTDDLDREENKSDCWAEYLEADGLIDWKNEHLAGVRAETAIWMQRIKDFDALFTWADQEVYSGGANPYANMVLECTGMGQFVKAIEQQGQTVWDVVRVGIRPLVDDAWQSAVKMYTDYSMNVTALALAGWNLISATRYSQEEFDVLTENVELVENVVQGEHNKHGATLADYIDTYYGELMDYEDESADLDTTDGDLAEQQRLIDVWAETAEKEMATFWLTQAPATKSTSFVAAWFPGDVEFCKKYRAAVIGGEMPANAVKFARSAA